MPHPKTNVKARWRLAAILVVSLALAACVAGSGEFEHAAAGGALSQAVLGFWHGVIAPVTLIIEIVNRLAPHLLPWRAHLYESKAAGVAYDIGFYIGLAGGPPILWTRFRR